VFVFCAADLPPRRIFDLIRRVKRSRSRYRNRRGRPTSRWIRRSTARAASTSSATAWRPATG